MKMRAKRRPFFALFASLRRIYLLDCPGIVPPTASDFAQDCAKAGGVARSRAEPGVAGVARSLLDSVPSARAQVLKGVVRAERLKTPSDYIHEARA